VAPQLDDVAHDFYGRLFAQHPELRGVFPADLALQEKKFAESIEAIVAAIPDFGAFAERSAQLGRVHAAHRISASEYGSVGLVLVSALAAADPGWDAALRTSGDR
jgi:hemoglobin-like flavoprotein